MVNDFRCLLANLTPTQDFDPGEVFVPPDYTPRTLDRFELTIRNVLFGTNPDRLMVNYRCFQFLRLLHASKWAEAVTAVDRRTTYDPWIWPGTQVNWSKEVISNSTLGILLSGIVTPNDAEGVCNDLYTVRINNLGTATILRRSVTIANIPYTFSNGVSNPIALGNTGLNVVFNAVPSNGQSADILVPREPGWSLGQIELEIMDKVDFGTISALVNAGTDMQSITSTNLWYRSRDTQARLCGIVMALVNYARSRS